MLQLPVPVYRNYGSSAWFAAAVRAGRAIQAVTRQSSEPNRLADVGVQILIGPLELWIVAREL
jgi:hypothetical protein